MTDVLGAWGPLAEPFHTDKELPPDSPPWRENSFLAFFDRERRVYGTAHLTGALNAGGRRARTSVVVDGTAAEIVEPLDAGSFATPGVKLDLAGGLRAGGANLDVDISFAPRLDTIDYSASNVLPGLSAAEPLRHYQRSGTFTGSIGLNGVTVPVDGGCLRDRTWGYREENQHWLEYYGIFLCFSSDQGDFDLAVMKFRTADRGTHAHGYLTGQRRGHISASQVRRNAWGSVTELRVEVDDQDPIVLTAAPPEARIMLPLGEPDGAAAITAYDEFVEVTTPEGRTGFGIIEQGILRRLG